MPQFTQVALGVVRGQHAYWRNRWNKLDFILVGLGWLGLISSKVSNCSCTPISATIFGAHCVHGFAQAGTELGIDPKTMRLLRCMRPLRSLQYFEGVRTALAQWQFLRNVMFLLAFTISIFGVLGIQFFGGALTYRCSSATQITATTTAGSWESASESEQTTGCPPAIDCPSDICVKVNRPLSEESKILQSGIGAASNFGSALISHSGAEDGNMTADAASELEQQLGRGTSFAASGVNMFFERSEWGFDKITDAMMTGWIVTTGDMWGLEMLPQMQATESRYVGQAWSFFTVLFLVMSMVIANLFSAIIVHAYFTTREESEDFDGINKTIRIERALFARLDTKNEGEIRTEHLSQIVELFGLELTNFDKAEVQRAIEDIDMDGNSAVDFEEFSIWWLQNSPFVVKIKKALRKQERSIREVWSRIDIDGDDSLSDTELESMAGSLGISLTPHEVAAAIEEMRVGEEGVSYTVFVAWWLSISKVAAKVRTATQNMAENVTATFLFETIDRSETGIINANDLIHQGQVAFGEKVNLDAAREILREILDADISADDDGESGSTHEISLSPFLEWWSSDEPWATKIRRKSREDLADVHILFSQFDKGWSAARDSEEEPVLDPDEISRMKSQLSISYSVDEICQSITAANPVQKTGQRADTWSTSNFDMEASFSCSCEEFYRFLYGPGEVSTSVRTQFGLFQERLERQRLRPFPFVPGLSPACFTLTTHPAFEIFIFAMVGANVMILACQYHEMELEHPNALRVLEQIDVGFGVLFVCEACLKIFGVGLRGYFRQASNRFDFFIVSVIVVQWYLAKDSESTAGAMRGARVLVRSLRVARTARILANVESVQLVITTVANAGTEVLFLSVFAMFMLCLLSIVGGQLLGYCFSTTPQPGAPPISGAAMPVQNYFTFGGAFHSNFLILMGEGWSPIMFKYQECEQTSWIFFVVVLASMKYFVANLFVAMLVDGFSMSEQEKLVKQERNYIKNLQHESMVVRTMGITVDENTGGPPTQSGLKGAHNAMKHMAAGLRVQKHLTGALAIAQHQIDRSIPAADEDQEKRALSCNALATDHPIRSLAISVSEDIKFQQAVWVTIIVSSASMAAEGPPGALAAGDKTVFEAINTTTLVAFWAECLIKVTANGFYGTPSAYLQDAWNRFDFLVVVLSSLEFVVDRVSTNDGNVTRIVRALRIIKPLRLIKENESMQFLLEALHNVLPTLLGVLALAALFFVMFAILGQSLFMGRFYFCSCEGDWGLPLHNCTDSGHRTLNMTACIEQGGTWENPPSNFDNFFSALRALYFSSVGDGGQIIQSGMDVSEVYSAPELNKSWENAAFFWVFSLFSQFFILNIFIGILTNYFLESSGAALLTESQAQWTQIQLSALLLQPRTPDLPAEGTISRIALDLVTHRRFEPIVTLVILFNVGALYVERAKQSSETEKMLDVIEIMCLWFFTIDVLIRVSAWGIGEYLQDNWSKLDLAVVMTSWISRISGTASGFSAMRALRVLRVLMLMKRMDTMRPIIRALILSIPPCANVLVLTMLVLFVFSVAGMNMFGLLPHGQYLTSSDNFDTFGNAFKRLTQICTGQEMIDTTYELENMGVSSAFPFFFVFTVVTQLVLVNLFVVILVDSFMRSLVMSKLEVHDEHMVSVPVTTTIILSPCKIAMPAYLHLQ